MIFSSITFMFLFFPAVIALYFCMPGVRMKNSLLTLASLIFYAWGEPVYILLMLFSVLLNWLLGLWIDKRPELANGIMALTLCLNLGILCYFKYAQYLVELWNQLTGMEVLVRSIPLPVGISFFTFQALSYVVDVKRGQATVQKNYFNLLLYISLFPQLIAGPIVKYHDIEVQICKREINIDRVSHGLQRFVIGLTKKVMIANNMALLTDTIFAMPVNQLDAFSAWIGAITYVLQIYYDFSGYSDMAIGLGKVLGFDFMENFNYPLTATSIKDFWRRWHISLSTWFREYLYIPLGGNRKGVFTTYRNQMIVFIATGFWHGAQTTFLVWGLLHGLCLVLESSGKSPVDKLPFIWMKRIYTLLVVSLLFVIFRADSMAYAVAYIKCMFSGFYIAKGTVLTLSMLDVKNVMFISLGVICARNYKSAFVRSCTATGKYMWITQGTWQMIFYGITLVFLLLNTLTLASNAYNPFIYFRF